jgi:hypothetical protein
MISFRLARHSIFKERTIVEILSDRGKVIGTIYPLVAGPAIKVVSAHVGDVSTEEDFAGDVMMDEGKQSWPPIPAVYIKFDPSPYIIQGRKVVRIQTQPATSMVTCEPNGNRCNICGRPFDESGEICDGGHRIGERYYK